VWLVATIPFFAITTERVCCGCPAGRGATCPTIAADPTSIVVIQLSPIGLLLGYLDLKQDLSYIVFLASSSLCKEPCMARVMVTGGAGFIGSHLVTALVERGDDVTVIDDLSTGKRENLAHLADRFRLVPASILDRAALADAAQGAELVFHLAAMVSVPLSVKEPARCHELCATGSLNVLLAAIDAGARRLVYSGTSAVYGDSAVCPIDESSPLDPMSPYAAGKLAGELYGQTFARLGSIEVVRLRYFNVFGPRQDPRSPYSGVISLFFDAMLPGKRPNILGDGLQSRDFVYVANVVDANLRAAHTPGVSGRVYNIGAGGRQTLLDLVASLNRAMGTNLEPTFGQPRAGDVRHSQANIAAAQRDLDYRPSVSFDEGLAQCLTYYRATT
jgi:UDP-glucose 4-epimerase